MQSPFTNKYNLNDSFLITEMIISVYFVNGGILHYSRMSSSLCMKIMMGIHTHQISTCQKIGWILGMERLIGKKIET